MSQFLFLQDLTGRPFQVDACCHSSGSNALCKQFFSSKDSFLAADVTGCHIWMNAPFRHLTEFIQHYISNKNAQPANTFACIVVPCWSKDSPWRPLLHGMQLLHVYPVGTPLFSMPSTDGRRVTMSGIPWPVEIWYDPPGVRPVVSVATSLPHAHLGQVGGNEGPIMTFNATVNGSPGIVLADSGANRCIADTSLAREQGVVFRACNTPVQLADGSAVMSEYECTMTVRIQGMKWHVNCLVMNLDRKFNVILGDDWLHEKQAVISFQSKTLQVLKKGMRVLLYPRESLIDDARAESTQAHVMITAIQAKRAIRHGCNHFVVNVIDDGVTPLASAPKSVEDILHPAVSKLVEKYKSIFSEGNNGLPPERNLGHAIITEPGAKPPY